MATGVFGSAEKAELWLGRSNAVFDDRKPVDLLSTESGGYLVQDELIRIDHGMFA